MVAYPAQANNYVYFVNPVGIIEWSGPLQQRHWLELKTHHCFQNSRVHYNRSWPIEGSGKQILVQTAGDPSATRMVTACTYWHLSMGER